MTQRSLAQSLKHLEDQLLKLRDPNKVIQRSLPYTRLAISVPKLRSLTGKIFSQDSDAQLPIWDYIWTHSSYFEAMNVALYHYQHRLLSIHEGKCLLHWIERCYCWEHSDDLSKIYAGLLEAYPKEWYPYLKAWNTGSNPWKRRQSLVSLLEYARKRKRILPFSKMKAMVQRCLHDKDYYVQKGLGWTLREMQHVYPQETLEYMQIHLHHISPLAYAAATEKLPRALRDKLKEQRKQHRKQKRRL